MLKIFLWDFNIIQNAEPFNILIKFPVFEWYKIIPSDMILFDLYTCIIIILYNYFNYKSCSCTLYT